MNLWYVIGAILALFFTHYIAYSYGKIEARIEHVAEIAESIEEELE